MIIALVLGLVIHTAKAEAFSAEELVRKNPAMAKFVKGVEEAGGLECFPQAAMPTGVSAFNPDGSPQSWHLHIPCSPRGSTGVEPDVLAITYILKDDVPTLYSEELRVPTQK